jgi:hypothetical protein
MSSILPFCRKLFRKVTTKILPETCPQRRFKKKDVLLLFFEGIESLTQKQVMTREEREQKAWEIVVEVLELLKSKNLTVADGWSILCMAQKVMHTPLLKLEEVSTVSVPELAMEYMYERWGYIRPPDFANLDQ